MKRRMVSISASLLITVLALAVVPYRNAEAQSGSPLKGQAIHTHRITRP